ncbi:MAG: hypothetical protein CM15mP49_29270 [Actinomycetota bacterium]|nr:MAG: hypothetical protein CM15mP49_29270 [Actinomycetota bacterium]
MMSPGSRLINLMVCRSYRSGGTDTFTVVLDAQPTSDVVIALTSSDTGEATISGSLTFTPANWDTPQTVTVTGVDDNLIDGTIASSVAVTIVDAISDNDFDSIPDQTVSVSTTDDDVAGFTVDQLDGSVEVTEAGGTDTSLLCLTHNQHQMLLSRLFPAIPVKQQSTAR